MMVFQAIKVQDLKCLKLRGIWINFDVWIDGTWFNCRKLHIHVSEITVLWLVRYKPSFILNTYNTTYYICNNYLLMGSIQELSLCATDYLSYLFKNKKKIRILMIGCFFVIKLLPYIRVGLKKMRIFPHLGGLVVRMGTKKNKKKHAFKIHFRPF